MRRDSERQHLKLLVAKITVLVLSSGCVYQSQTVRLPNTAAPTKPIRSISVAAGGVLAEAIGFELAANYEFELVADGADAVIEATWEAGYDGKPETVFVQLIDAQSAAVVGAVRWHNSGGGEKGSALDRRTRKDVTAAAAEIAYELIYELPQFWQNR